MEQIAQVTFKAQLNRQGSWGTQSLGEFTSTMTLYVNPNDTSYFLIEWDIPALDTTEEIGIWTENKVLTDYDGVFSLPKEAIQLLRDNGITVPVDFE